MAQMRREERVDLTGGNPRLGIKNVHARHLFVADNEEVVHYSVEKVKCTPLIDQYVSRFNIVLSSADGNDRTYLTSYNVRGSQLFNTVHSRQGYD